MSAPCRRCGGTEHYAREVDAAGEGHTLLPIGFFKVAKLIVQVCGTCGLIEWSVPERFLPDVKKKFAKLP